MIAEPSIIPTLEELIYNDKTVVAISVQEFPVKPISFQGRYYKRVNNSNHQLSLVEITNMNLQSLQLSWDAYEKQGKRVSDLSIEKIERFIKQVNETGRFSLTNGWIENLQKSKHIRLWSCLLKRYQTAC